MAPKPRPPRKFKCIGGPLNGEMHTYADLNPRNYVQYNLGERSKQLHTAVFIHKSIVWKVVP